MRELQRRQKTKKILYSVPFLIILLVLTFFLVKGAFGIIQIERESAGKVKALEAEALALSSRERELKDEIALLETEEGQVREIREKFSVTREGEHVAVIVESKNVATSTKSGTLNWLKALWKVIMLRND